MTCLGKEHKTQATGSVQDGSNFFYYAGQNYSWFTAGGQSDPRGEFYSAQAELCGFWFKACDPVPAGRAEFNVN